MEDINKMTKEELQNKIDYLYNQLIFIYGDEENVIKEQIHECEYALRYFNVD